MREALDSPYLESLRNGKGNITQKAIKGRLEEILMSEEQTVLENYIKTLKEVGADKKKVNAQIKEAFEKVKALITEKPKADYLLELSIVMRYLDLIAKETKLKDEIKKALAELEIKVIQQYPKLSIEEIKTLTVDKKWMASMHKNVRTEMDGISHRLIERIKVLAERYETPMPKLTNDVAILTAKVEEHLKKMDYVW